jgi:hypothetical protein
MVDLFNKRLVSLVLASAIGLSSLAACGGKKDPGPPPAESHPVKVQQLSRQWGQPNADKVQSSGRDAETPREVVANRLIETVDLLPLGASRETVIKLLGRPRSTRDRTWSYIAARRRPSDGFGGWCERRFTVSFDARGRVIDETLHPPECPRGLNP